MEAEMSPMLCPHLQGLHLKFKCRQQKYDEAHLLSAVWISFSPFFTSVKKPFKNLRPLKWKREENYFKVQMADASFSISVSGKAGSRQVGQRPF